MNNIISKIAIDYMINAPCNLKCPFCYGPNPDMKGELSKQSKILLFDKLRSNGVNKIVIGGGEPTLSNDLYDLIRYGNSIGIGIGLQTNSFFLSKIDLGLQYLDWLAIPFDGISIESQVMMRTNEKHFEVLLESLNYIKYKKSQGAINQLKIKIGTVISKYNIDEIEKMAMILSEYDINVWKLYKVRKRGKGIAIFDEFEVGDEIVNNIVRTIKAKHKNLNIYYSSYSSSIDSYIIIDPDSSTYVIKGLEQHLIGKLISENGNFSQEIWDGIVGICDLNSIITNINKSFPNWN